MIARARQSAYRVLQDVELHGKYSNVALQQVFRKNAMDDRDKALCTEIVYGTLQAQRSLDSVIAPMCRRGLEALDPKVLVLLRMAIYQLAFLSRVPSYAVLDDAVELCKRSVPKAAPFVNGVLRTYTRDGRPFSERLLSLVEDADPSERLGVVYSFPSWLTRRLVQEYGEERAERILQACNERSTLSVRVNVRQIAPEEFIARLPEEYQEEAVLSRVTPFGVRLPRGVDVENWSLYQNGLVTVQDEASMLIAPLVQPSKRGRIIDMCAGMGTKTTQILELLPDAESAEGMERETTVDAVDIHQHKLQALKVAAERLSVRGFKTILADARSLGARPKMRGAYDAVLLDAPCSGTGVLRRRPEIRWRRTEADVQELTKLQRELIRTAVELTAPGGIIVYATCSILDDENSLVIQGLLREYEGVLCVDSVEEDVNPNVWMTCRQDHTKGISITPEQFGTDGFYMVRLRKLI